ncbi:hypothetical protein GCM10023232_26660 [Sphingosinicella ginsenosidimutans]|uniref:Uncharacterized protein n=1 Tax=Allosphingosinicella ginsenosidimutans TaxID=1176539 RepID=A0A5C6TTP7_9SPHN|nr:hypothetical protein [Sphingosinicella ginsenosidimutans]TXC63717.1 hypothetical protein FRZ32_08625 [Sphingosinicella ginsenosidimutans]
MAGLQFEIEPALVAEAIAEGRKLLVQVDRLLTPSGYRWTYRCVVGGPSDIRQPVGIKQRRAA